MAQIITCSLNLLALKFQLAYHGLFSVLDGLELLDTYTPEVDNQGKHDDVGCNHPPRQQEVALNVYLNHTLLSTYCTLSVNGLYMQNVATCLQIVECHTVSQGVTIAPILITTLHPVHKLQALTLVIVTSSKLDGECVLTMTQVNAACLVQSLIQYYISVILMSCQHLFLANKQLGKHYSWQLLLLGSLSVQHPVHTIQSAQQYLAVLLGKYRTHVELVTLQSVSSGVVIESVVVNALLVVALYHNTAHTAACRYPYAVILVLSNTADVVVTQSLFLCEVVKLVGLKVQNIQSLARSYPYKSA